MPHSLFPLSPEALNAQFGRPGQLTFTPGPGHLTVAEINNRYASAAVALYGGHLLHYQPHGQPPVVWLSPHSFFQPGKAIRGGLPICWPWFGAHPTAASLPAHGFARLSAAWTVLSTAVSAEGDTLLQLGLSDDPASREMWPHPFRLELQLSVGAALAVTLIVHNSGPEPFEMTAALHTYLGVSHAAEVTVEGLDGVDYLDKVKDFRRFTQRGPVVFAGETDHVYLPTTAACRIIDPGWGRQITVSKQGSRTTVVWNPGAEKAAHMADLLDAAGMVCVEAANAFDDAIRVPPGGEHRLHTRIEAGPLPG
jgi:glucose-6-phosphate 1-epimerase